MYLSSEQDGREFFWAAWKDYAKLLGSLYKGKVHYYQVLNEEDNPTLSLLKAEDEPKAFTLAWEGLRDGIAPGVAPGQHRGHFETVVNVLSAWFAPLIAWQYTLEGWARGPAGPYIDVLAADHYPALPGDYRDMVKLLQLGARFGKGVAIMETGASEIWASAVGGGFTGQEVYAQNAIVALSNLKKLDRLFGNLLRMVAWYELYDKTQEEAYGFIDYLGNGTFGLVEGDRVARKRSYEIMKARLLLSFEG
jgi:hypothetical protein